MKLGLMPMKADKPIILSSIVIILYLAGCAHQPPSVYERYSGLSSGTPVEISSRAPFSRPINMYHIVGPQETLWRISKSYAVSIETLMRVNRITNPTQIKNGQRLMIPNTYGPRPVVPLYPVERWTHIVIHHTATHVGNAFVIDQMHHQRGFWNGPLQTASPDNETPAPAACGERPLPLFIAVPPLLTDTGGRLHHPLNETSSGIRRRDRDCAG